MNTIFQNIQNLHNASGENGYNCAKHEHRLAAQKSGQKMSTPILQICTSTAGLSFFNSSHIIIHITTIITYFLSFLVSNFGHVTSTANQIIYSALIVIQPQPIRGQQIKGMTGGKSDWAKHAKALVPTTA